MECVVRAGEGGGTSAGNSTAPGTAGGSGSLASEYSHEFRGSFGSGMVPSAMARFQRMLCLQIRPSFVEADIFMFCTCGCARYILVLVLMSASLFHSFIPNSPTPTSTFSR